MALDVRKGRTKAYIDLVGMESDIAALMRKPLPIVIALGIGAQLALTTFMVWYSQGTLRPPAMDPTEPEIMFRTLLIEHPVQNPPRRSTTTLNRESSTMEEGGNHALRQQHHEDEELDDESPLVLPAASLNSSGSLLQDYEMDDFLLRRRESARTVAHRA